MNTTLRLGQRKLPTALELKIIETLQTTTLKQLYSDKPYSLEAPLSAGALLAILNGDFETPNSGWQTRGDSNILNGQAILSEDSKYLSNLRQTFTIPEGTKALQFTLVNTNLDDSAQAPPDAFEVALLDDQNQSVVQTAQGLTQTDALLNVQHDGTTYTSDQVKLAGLTNSGDTLDLSAPRTVQIDLSDVPAGTVVTLFFDLLGFGEKDASVIIDDVQLLTELSQAPIAQNDDATVFANSDTQLDILANDQDPDGTIDPATVQIIGTPNNGTVTTNPDGTVTYTPNSGFFGLDEFIYIVQDNNGVISNSAKVSLVVLDPAPTIESLTIESDLKEGTPAHFSASASSASNSPLTYTWDLGDGTTAEGDTLNHTYANNGSYTVTLTVTNDNGISSIERRTVTVENLAPSVDLTGPTSINEGHPSETYSATANDPGDDTVTYTWNFGDGSDRVEGD